GSVTRLTEAQFGLVARLSATPGQWVRSNVLQREVLKAHAAFGASNVRFHILKARAALGTFAMYLHGSQRRGYMWSPHRCDYPHCKSQETRPLYAPPSASARTPNPVTR